MGNDAFFPTANAYLKLATAAKQSDPEAFIEAAESADPALLVNACSYLNWILSQTTEHNAASPDEHQKAQSALAEVSALAAAMMGHHTEAWALREASGTAGRI